MAEVQSVSLPPDDWDLVLAVCMASRQSDSLENLTETAACARGQPDPNRFNMGEIENWPDATWSDYAKWRDEQDEALTARLRNLEDTIARQLGKAR